jgi:hypothetical protein
MGGRAGTLGFRAHRGRGRSLARCLRLADGLHVDRRLVGTGDVDGGDRDLGQRDRGQRQRRDRDRAQAARRRGLDLHTPRWDELRGQVEPADREAGHQVAGEVLVGHRQRRLVARGDLNCGYDRSGWPPHGSSDAAAAGANAGATGRVNVAATVARACRRRHS